MVKTKAQADSKDKTALTPTVQKQPETPEKPTGPLLAAPAETPALPSANGTPPATRAANVMTAPDMGTVHRARMIIGLQQTVGNARISRLVGTAVQAKLTLGAVDDAYEREADQVAGQVTDQTTPTVQPPAQPRAGQVHTLQRQPEDKEGETEVESKIEQSIQRARSGGQPLAGDIRRSMEQSFDADFSGVKVHTDAASDALNRSLNARAFTTGQDIFFRQGEYNPGGMEGQQLIAHELTHVAQQNSSSPTYPSRMTTGLQRTIQRKRSPDIVFKGHYTFYLKTGKDKEFAVQFYYPGTGSSVNIKVAHQPSLTMRSGTITLPASATFNPVVTVDSQTITLFDLDGDGNEDVSVQAVVDDYTAEYLTQDTKPLSPSVKSFKKRDVYVAATWRDGSLSFQVAGKLSPQAIAPPLWIMQPHPHPNIGMVYMNTTTRQYVIPPSVPYSLSSTAKGPPPFFQQQSTLRHLRSQFQPQAAGTEAVTDPFRQPAPSGTSNLTAAHQNLRNMPVIPHTKVPTWGAMDVAKWKTTGGRAHLLAYKDKWVRGYRNIIRAAADTYDIPRVLLAGVAYNEVGGMMDWMDDVAYGTRKVTPFTKDPKLTSIAPMSLQVRRAAEELGYDPEKMTKAQMDAVVASLQDPQQAIFLAAKHLATLRDIDFKGKTATTMTFDEIVITGTRYNQGSDKPLAQIMLNRDYGIAIVKRGQHLLKLLDK